MESLDNFKAPGSEELMNTTTYMLAGRPLLILVENVPTIFSPRRHWPDYQLSIPEERGAEAPYVELARKGSDLWMMSATETGPSGSNQNL